MSEPTTSLASLRRLICRELGMPFHRRYSAGFLDADSGTTTSLVDSALTQKDKFWKGAWVYRVASQEVSRIVDFVSKTNTVTLEVPITAFAPGDDYEIHNLWNAVDIHDAINQAIRDSRRVFREVVTDETLIVEEDKLEYDISGLTKTPFIIQRIWLERPTSVMRGVATAGTATTITLDVTPSGVTDDWKISIYAGTGAGQLRDVSSISGKDVTVAAWDTTPDSTSKYALWNPTEQIQDWMPWDAVRYDSTKEYPDTLYFSRRPLDFQGLRIRLEYTALPAELSAEADTTVIPSSYLIPAAVSKLHSRKVGDTKADRELHFAEAKRYQEMAEEWLVRYAPQHPDTGVLRQHYTAYLPSTNDPLGWGDN